MGIRKCVQYHEYLSSVSLRLQMNCPNTWISRFTRQLDLELMFTSIVSLCKANWNKWTKLFTDLLTLSTGSTIGSTKFYLFNLVALFNLVTFFYWLYSLTYWLYLLALFIHWLYLFDLMALFTSLIYGL